MKITAYFLRPDSLTLEWYMRGANWCMHIRLPACWVVAEKKWTCLAIRALLILSTSTPTSLLHPPTTTYKPRSIANSLMLTAADWCGWVRAQGSWSSRGVSRPSVPSHRASRPCQPSLGETVKTFPFRGFMVQLRTIDTKNLQRRTALEPRAESPRSGEISGRPPPYEASVSSGSFLY